MKDCKNFLSGKEFISDHAYKKRRDDSGNGHRTVGRSNLYTGSMQHFIQISPHRYIPGAPYKKFQEHHQRQLDPGSRLHEQSVCYRRESENYEMSGGLNSKIFYFKNQPLYCMEGLSFSTFFLLRI